MNTINNEETILSYYNMTELLDFFSKNEKFKNIALQFDDKLLPNSLTFVNMLKRELPDKFIFMIGETSYGLCCADEIAAQHLNADIIIRVGESCFSLNKQIPIYFLFENRSVNLVKLTELLDSLSKDNREIYLFYKHNYHHTIRDLKLDKLHLALIPYRPDIYDKEGSFIYGRYFTSTRNITRDDVIIYLGSEEDQLCRELIYRYHSNISSFYWIDDDDKKEIAKTNYSLSKIDLQNFHSWSPFFHKRFHLIQKAKDSQVFGIIVGSLSIKGVNEIIESIKGTLKLQKKKFYTFLLGKITLEKLSNFVEYVDCFILIACPFNTFYDVKALMRPLVTPLDIKYAFDASFEWNMSYSFDINYILSQDKEKDLVEELKGLEIAEQKKLENYRNITSLSETEKNQMVANIFSVNVLECFDSKKYKGLETNFQDNEVKKFTKGKRGIPLKYENIK